MSFDSVENVTPAERLDLWLHEALNFELWTQRISKWEFTREQLDDAFVELVHDNPGIGTADLIHACELTGLWRRDYDGVRNTYWRVLGVRIVQPEFGKNYVIGEEPDD